MLFVGAEAETDHRYFTNLRKTEFRPDVAEWCEATYARAQALLDADFPSRFRRETPQRISELLFAAAFLDAGWEPIGRVPGFDLAFKHQEGRLLVEVTTPDPHGPDTWTEEERDGFTVTTSDARTMDAALRRLTAGFANKADAIRKRCEAGEISEADYLVVAISAFRLAQEASHAPEIGGPVPDFVKAFLPIGSRYVRVRIGEGSDTPMGGGYEFKGTIDQEGKAPVDRNAFLRPEFAHIHAVAYTPLHFGEPISPLKECAALHNPTAGARDAAVRFGWECEFGVDVGEDKFSLRPLR
jgi:hypothetical protein